MLASFQQKLISYLRSLTDLRALGQLFFVIIVLLISWSGIKAIQANYELQKKIARLEQEVDIKKLENENLKLSNQYLETDQFLDLAARRQFGKAAKGEKLLVVPREVALSFTKGDIKNEENTKNRAKKPGYQQNLEDWINFFFRKSQNKLLQ